MTRAPAADAALVRRARRGDQAAFGALVRRHLGAVHRLTCAVLEEPAGAEDVVQDAFLAALERLDRCRPDGAFEGWLLAIARDRALDRRHRRGCPIGTRRGGAYGGGRADDGATA